MSRAYLAFWTAAMAVTWVLAAGFLWEMHRLVLYLEHAR